MSKIFINKSLAISVIMIFSASSAAFPSDWSSWEYFGSSKNVKIYWKYRDNSCGSHVRWRAVNNSNRRVWPSVRNKKYKCANGGIDTASNESIGSTNLRPGGSSATQADTCLCKGRGGVSSASISISIKDP